MVTQTGTKMMVMKTKEMTTRLSSLVYLKKKALQRANPCRSASIGTEGHRAETESSSRSYFRDPEKIGDGQLDENNVDYVQ